MLQGFSSPGLVACGPCVITFTLLYRHLCTLYTNNKTCTSLQWIASIVSLVKLANIVSCGSYVITVHPAALQNPRTDAHWAMYCIEIQQTSIVPLTPTQFLCCALLDNVGRLSCLAILQGLFSFLWYICFSFFVYFLFFLDFLIFLNKICTLYVGRRWGLPCLAFLQGLQPMFRRPHRRPNIYKDRHCTMCTL